MLWHSNSKTCIDDKNNEIIDNLFEIDKNKQTYDFIIDGQQRISTLLMILKNIDLNNKLQKNNSKSKFLKYLSNIKYCVDKNEFIKINNKKELSTKTFPNYLSLDEMFNDKDWEEWQNYLLDKHPNLEKQMAEELWNKLGKVISKINNLEFGKITLEGYSLDEAIDVFNEINTSGKKLSIFEIINSRWSTIGINIKNDLNELFINLDIEKLDKIIFIDSLYLIIDKNKKMIGADEKLAFNPSTNKDENINIYNKFQKTFELSWKTLKECGFYFKNLPSSMILKWLSYYIWKNNNKKPEGDSLNLIKRYIALISINEHYSKSSTSKLEKDLKFVDELINNLNPTFNFEELKVTNEIILSSHYNKNSMKDKFIATFLINECKELGTNNKIINFDDEDIELHHIFPKNAKLNNKTFKELHKEINSFANLIPIDKQLNKQISNKKPSDYYDEISKKNSKLNDTLKDSFINVNHFINNDFDNFINDRANKIANKINKEFSLE